jgi:hypothetical protein
VGKGTLHAAHVTASISASARSTDDIGSPRPGMEGPLLPGGVGFQGGGVLGGAGSGRTSHSVDASSKHNLKMSFPKFDGDQLGILMINV